MTSKLDILAGLPCVNSRKTAQTIIDELRGRGIHLVAEDEMADEMDDMPPLACVGRGVYRARVQFDSGLPGEGKVFRTYRLEPNPYNPSFTFNPNDPFSTS